ncbi:MAG TPA: PIN domain-containing protein [Actinomycetota bacterium]|nr:PIN domain-containing protein [Actinomycetota bacterium]
MPVFVDTNVLVYARDASEPGRQPQALAWIEHLWRTRTGRLSFQVLQEYYATTTRRLRPGLHPEQARADVRDLLAWRPVPTGAEVLEAGWRVEDRFGLSCWDGLIVAAARIAGCEYLLTEDLQHGSDLDGLRVIDPFQVTPDALSS